MIQQRTRARRKPSPHIKVVLADGRKIVREGLRFLLEQQADIRVIGEADGTMPAVRLARALAADVAVLNVSLATRGVAQAVRELAAAGGGEHRISVLVMPMTADAPFVRDVLRAGGRGVLTRECAFSELVSAIRTAAQGDVYLSPKLAQLLLVADDLTPPTPGAKKPTLSSRERDIVERIANGFTTKEIAHELGVSTKTVETHRRRIMEKLGLNSVAALTKYAIRTGLTSLEASP